MNWAQQEGSGAPSFHLSLTPAQGSRKTRCWLLPFVMNNVAHIMYCKSFFRGVTDKINRTSETQAAEHNRGKRNPVSSIQSTLVYGSQNMPKLSLSTDVPGFCSNNNLWAQEIHLSELSGRTTHKLREAGCCEGPFASYFSTSQQTKPLLIPLQITGILHKVIL